MHLVNLKTAKCWARKSIRPAGACMHKKSPESALRLGVQVTGPVRGQGRNESRSGALLTAALPARGYLMPVIKSQIFYWRAKGGFGCPSVLGVIVCGAAKANSVGADMSKGT